MNPIVYLWDSSQMWRLLPNGTLESGRSLGTPYDSWCVSVFHISCLKPEDMSSVEYLKRKVPNLRIGSFQPW